jgi:hypothetical protein
LPVLSREIIAKLPPEVSEVAKMDELTTVAEGESLLAQVTLVHGSNQCQVSTPALIGRIRMENILLLGPKIDIVLGISISYLKMVIHYFLRKL